MIRMAAMITPLHQDGHTDPFDTPGCNRLREIHAHAISALTDGRTLELRDELQRLALP